jgi:hypothetical protein
VADDAFRLGIAEERAQDGDVLADRGLCEQPSGARIALLEQPPHEALDVAGLDLGEAQAADPVEVGDDAVVEHLPVAGARRFAQPARGAARVVGDPVAGVVAEAHPIELDELAAVAVGLRLALAAPGVVERAGAAPPLAAIDPVGVEVDVAAGQHRARSRRASAVDPAVELRASEQQAAALLAVRDAGRGAAADEVVDPLRLAAEVRGGVRDADPRLGGAPLVLGQALDDLLDDDLEQRRRQHQREAVGLLWHDTHRHPGRDRDARPAPSC